MGQIKKEFGEMIVEISRGCSLGNKCEGSIVRLLFFIFYFFCSKIYNVVLDRSPWQTIYNK